MSSAYQFGRTPLAASGHLENTRPYLTRLLPDLFDEARRPNRLRIPHNTHQRIDIVCDQHGEVGSRCVDVDLVQIAYESADEAPKGIGDQIGNLIRRKKELAADLSGSAEIDRG